jgi:hypothetical protein
VTIGTGLTELDSVQLYYLEGSSVLSYQKYSCLLRQKTEFQIVTHPVSNEEQFGLSVSAIPYYLDKGSFSIYVALPQSITAEQRQQISQAIISALGAYYS